MTGSLGIGGSDVGIGLIVIMAVGLVCGVMVMTGIVVIMGFVVVITVAIAALGTEPVPFLSFHFCHTQRAGNFFHRVFLSVLALAFNFFKHFLMMTYSFTDSNSTVRRG